MALKSAPNAAMQTLYCPSVPWFIGAATFLFLWRKELFPAAGEPFHCSLPSESAPRSQDENGQNERRDSIQIRVEEMCFTRLFALKYVCKYSSSVNSALFYYACENAWPVLRSEHHKTLEPKFTPGRLQRS